MCCLPFSTINNQQFDFIISIKHDSNRMGGVMLSMLASSAIDSRFEPRSGQTKSYTFGMSCFSTKHAALKRKIQLNVLV